MEESSHGRIARSIRRAFWLAIAALIVVGVTVTRFRSIAPSVVLVELAVVAAVLMVFLRRIGQQANAALEQQSHLEAQAVELELSHDELGDSEAELRALVGALPDVVMVLGRDGEYRKIAPTAALLLYRPPAELLGRRVPDVLPPEASGPIMACIERAIVGGGPVEVEYMLPIERGPAWFIAAATRLNDDAVVWVARDVTAQRLVHEQLRESEARHRVLFERNPFPMWHYDVATLGILAVNESAIRHYGYTRDEFLRLTIRDMLPEGEAANVLADRPRPGAGQAHIAPHHHRKKDGTIITVEVFSDDAVAVGCDSRLVLARDVTDREQLESQLRQSQKMEAVGRLAGGVAHDFNNMLTAIKGYSQLVLDELPADLPARADVQEIDAAADRAATLTRQLLAFSRQQVLQPKVLDLNETVRGMEKMLCRLLMTDIRLALHLDARLGRIEADPGQLEQVLMNLVVNARDAMPEGGQLTVSTANVEVRESEDGRHGPHEQAPGSYVVLAVSDTGRGMSTETQGKIFEPFFTTKEPGSGTGLGLATVYGIVKQSSGSIRVRSELGEGTTFEIYLPRVEAAASVTKPADTGEHRAVAAERVLVVEDDPVVRAVAMRSLARAGYETLEAASGAEALRLLDGGERVSLVITDLIMPEMRGTVLGRVLRDRYPGLPVLLISGFTEGAMLEHGTLSPATAFLQKPFTPKALVTSVRALLDAA
jgi:PAS domain S-box-containing protein